MIGSAAEERPRHLDIPGIPACGRETAAIQQSPGAKARTEPRRQRHQSDPTFLDVCNTNVHITFVGKPSNRDKILTEGLRVVHERGFAGASVRDIVEAANVPQGSFTNHFASKEAFCLEILDLYFEGTRVMIRETLRNESLPPPKRLRAFVDAQLNYLKRNGWHNGCLIGNFSAEASEHSEVIRKRLVQIFEEMRQSVAYCLRAAVKSGDLSRKNDCDELAGFLVASLQGAILQSKVERTAVPTERFKQLLFSTLLR
jgi:TetR/AcrR family transcriptional repressor of nem operon